MALEMTEAPSTSDTAKIVPEDEKMSDNASKLVIVCVALANLIALVALVLAIVGVANNGSNEYYIGATNSDGSSGSASTGGTSAFTSSGDKIWMFQIGHFIGNTQYLDEDSGTIKGYNVDVVNAVCQIANKNCRLVWDLYERCWLSQAGSRPRGGEGLMGRWYDACVGWSYTADRARSVLFSDSFENFAPPVFIVASSRSLSQPPDLAGLITGHLDGWYADEHCLDMYDQVTNFQSSDKTRVIHYASEEDLADALVAGDIDAAFVPKLTYFTNRSDIKIGYDPDENKCLPFGGPAMMMQKDQIELNSWFNEGFRQLRATSEYDAICKNVANEHGDQPGIAYDDLCV